LITKVELRDSSSALSSTTYQYNASNELTKVTDNDTKTVKYEYAGDAGQAYSQFITKITDKMNRDSSFGWTFGQNGSYWEAYKIVVTDQAGLAESFERSISTSVCTVQKMTGTTVLAKGVNTPVSGDTSRTHYDDSYKDVSNYERWSFEWGATNDNTKTTKPGTVTDTTYTYTDKGRSSTDTSNLGVQVKYSYVAGGFVPTKMTDPAVLDTAYQYNGTNNLTKAVTPWSGSNGFQFGYTAAGLMTSATNPSSQASSFAYDALGRMTLAQGKLICVIRVICGETLWLFGGDGGGIRS
jgi:YD repeat-containing protein